MNQVFGGGNLMGIEVSAIGAIAALVIAIILILKKVPPAYGMIIGALIGGLIGGVNIVDTVSLMVEGAEGIIPAVLRILAAGVLAGGLILSGAASTNAESDIKAIGQAKALLALALVDILLTTAV